jgi:two-component system, cell cycle sensor histidine kinase and response regulator CckA
MLETSLVGVSKPRKQTPIAIYDTTPQVNGLDEQLRQLQKVDLVGRLAAGIAHDFNNILTAILGYADLLQKSEESTEQVRSDVGEIQRAAERAARLTRQILAFTRNESPAATLVDLNAVVTDVSKMLRRLIGETVQLIVGCEPAAIRVWADVGQMEQVLINLVVNARDAMPGGGLVKISTRFLTADAAFTAIHPDVVPGRYVVLEVADDGDGMSDDVRARMFEPFFTTKGPGRGTGLGLSVVWSIVRQNDGYILVDSAPGRGACFSVLLPAVALELPEAARPMPERRRFHGSGTVLLVEDDLQVRSLAALWLRRHGYVVHEAADGEEGRALVARAGIKPDVLITDVVLPNVSGGALADAVRRVSSSVKVLYMSGYPSCPEARQEELADHEVAFLAKPFSPTQLLSGVRTLLNWQGPERRVRNN